MVFRHRWIVSGLYSPESISFSTLLTKKSICDLVDDILLAGIEPPYGVGELCFGNPFPVILEGSLVTTIPGSMLSSRFLRSGL